jgi:Fe2+ transport protein
MENEGPRAVRRQRMLLRLAVPMGATAAVVALVALGLLVGGAFGDSHRAAAGQTTTSGMDGMSGMSMGTTTTSSMPMPVPMRTLGTATWQDMKIVVRASTPLPFVVFSGTSEREIRPTKKDSMHLMVMLSDAEGGMAIPYASVWATIRDQKGRIVFDERQWPMISRYMGPHYGNDVALPGKGTYRLTLLIGPPQAARHMEYAKL